MAEAPTVIESSKVETPTIQELAKKAFLRPMQAQQVKQSLEHAEEVLSKHEMLRNVYGADINVEEVQRMIELDKQTLEIGTPPEYNGALRNRLNRTRQMIEQSITYDMPTVDDMWSPTAQNIDKHMSWESAHKNEILAWKSICRILDPGNLNPNFTNIERLRGNTPPKGDPRKYWQAFDNIQWEEDIDEELIAAIDDHDYLGFLELRTLGWAKANICRRLEWSKDQYAAAVERFRRSQFVTDADAANMLEETAETIEVPNGDLPVEYQKPPKKTRKKKASRPVMESNKWPIPQLRDRGLTLAQFGVLSGIHRIRLSSVCSESTKAGGEWRDEEKQQIQAALDDYDRAHAFVAQTGE